MLIIVIKTDMVAFGTWNSHYPKNPNFWDLDACKFVYSQNMNSNGCLQATKEKWSLPSALPATCLSQLVLWFYFNLFLGV